MWFCLWIRSCLALLTPGLGFLHPWSTLGKSSVATSAHGVAKGPSQAAHAASQGERCCKPTGFAGLQPLMLDQARGLEGLDEAGEGACTPAGCEHREFGRCLCTQLIPGSWYQEPLPSPKAGNSQTCCGRWAGTPK